MTEVIVKMNKEDLVVLTAAGVAFVLFTRPQHNKWTPPESAKPYLNAINKASNTNNLPAGLLARVAYQESRFRPDIISGQVQSSAGAQGLMQIVPRWHPNVDPLDPFESIDYAADYLKRLFKKYKNWSDALAAYNWGQGNLDRYKRGELLTMPTETKNYIREITGDVGVS